MRIDRSGWTLLERLAVLLLLTAGCQGPARPAAGDDAAELEIRAALTELYDAFGFEAGGEPDWAAQRRLALPGASFVPSLRPDRDPVATGIEPFLADFRAFAGAEPWRSSGLFERIVGLRIERFGGLAQALVAFEGHVPDDERAVTRGLDAIQLVRTRDGWRVAAFATQFEGNGLRLPDRFLDRH